MSTTHHFVLDHLSVHQIFNETTGNHSSRYDSPMNSNTVHGDSCDLSPLLSTHLERRPYQAYCVSVTSSRPSSPQSLLSLPLHIKHRQIDLILPDQRKRKEENDQIRLSNCTMTTSARNDKDISANFPAGGTSEEQTNWTRAPNEENDVHEVVSMNSNHITQPITQYGNHFLARLESVACNEALRPLANSHPILNQIGELLSDPQHSGRKFCVTQLIGPNRPLPLLPLGQSRDTRSTIDKSTELPNIQQELDTASFADLHDSPRCFPDRSLAYEDEIRNDCRIHAGYNPSQSLQYFRIPVSDFGETVSVTDSEGDSGTHVYFSCTTSIIQPDTQSSALEDSLMQNSSSARPVFNHKLMPGGRELSSNAIACPTISPYEFAPNQIFPGQRSKPYEYIRHDRSDSCLLPPRQTRLGPRSPPWKSLEKLQEERKHRSDARERADISIHRNDPDTSASLKSKNGSTDDLGNLMMRREVEDYRNQVLKLYPDITFESRAAYDDKGCCSCTIM